MVYETCLHPHIHTQIETSGYVDFLLILMYFPREKGQPTKPKDESGKYLGCMPLWSGRVMPKVRRRAHVRCAQSCS